MSVSELSFDIHYCQECGKELKGRLGKKFCDPACKSAFHNRHKSFGEETIRIVNRILRHNRSILRTLCPEGKSTVRRVVLDQMGYDYRYFTNTYKSSKGGVYYLCYDYGFTLISDNGKNKALIIQKQDYMDKYVPC